MTFKQSLGLAAIVIVLDQLTKLWAEHALTLFAPQAIIDGFFYLTLAYNKGAAFSFLGDAGGWQRWFFIGLAVIISTYLLYWLRLLKPTQQWMAVCLSLILGGALGNVIDRLIYGHVIDFLDFDLGFMRYPAFNVADSAIVIGAFGLMWAILKGWDVTKHD